MISVTERWLNVHTMWLPKSGHASHEYEDAFAVSGLDTVRTPTDSRTFRAAVADGATESAFSGPWANRLAASFVQHGSLEPEIPALRQSFKRRAQRRLPWYLEAKIEEGAHAAVLGLEIHGDDAGRIWRATAVGDSCLFHVSSAGDAAIWPFDSPDAFHDTPELISSAADDPLPIFLQSTGTWQSGDAFILATDALAAWLMSAGPAALLNREDVFDDIVRDARAAGRMKDDDVTAVIAEIR